VATKTSFLVKLVAGLVLCLSMAGGLLAQPTLTVTINGTLGPWLSGSGEITTPGAYVSGVTATGTKGQYCVLTYVGSGSGATAKLLLSATNTPDVGTIAASDLLTVGSGYNGVTPPTSATAASGTATCSGTAVLTGVKVDDSIGLSGGTFTGTTTIDPVGLSYTGGTATYSAAVNLSVPSFPSGLNCTATITVKTPTSGNDTILSNCTFSALTTEFSSTVALPAGTLPAAVPLAFPVTDIVGGDASTATYTPTVGSTFDGDTTTLGIGVEAVSTISGACPSSGATACPTETLSPTTPLPFSVQVGSGTSAPQTVTVQTGGTNVAYAVTTSEPWLLVGGATTTGGTTGTSGGTFSVTVNPAGLAVGSYTGTVCVYTAAGNSTYSPCNNSSNTTPTVTVNLTVTPETVTLVPSPTSFTFNSVDSTSVVSGNLSVTTSPTSSVSYSASASTTSGGSWLSVVPTTGTAGGPAISVKADPTKTPGPGSYSGTITLTASGATTVLVPVTFNVTTVSAPSTLTFSATVGAGNPPTQPLSVTSSGPAVTYTAAVTSSSSWLSVTPGSGTTGGAAQTVSVNIAGLSSGSSPYTGTITVTPNGGAGIPVTVTLNLTSLPSMVGPVTTPAFTSNAGSVPSSQTLTVTSSSSTVISYNAVATTSTGGSWLQVSPTSGSTSGSETVSINSSVLSGLATGTYNGSILFTCSTGTCANPSGQLSVPVSLTVTAALASLPTSLTFNYTVGGSTPASQPITVSSDGGAITYTAVAATTSGGAWLAVSPASATTSASSPGITGSVNASALSGLAAGSYKGTITLTSAFATNSPYTIPATLVVTAQPTLKVSSSSLTFSMVATGTLPAAQGLTVTASDGSTIPFNVAVATSSGGSWLSSPTSGTTGTPISVSILANSLTPNTYNGTLTITSPQATGSVVVNVQLAVNSITLSPTSLTINYQLGGAAPGGQTLTVSSVLPSPLSFTAAASVSSPSGGTWLSVAPTSGTTPAGLTVTATPGSLGVGSYSGTITVSSGGVNFTMPVILAISTTPSLTATPSILPFTYTIGGSVPANQTVTVSSNGAALSGVNAVTSTPWLTVVSLSGTTTPVTMTVGLNPAGLPTTAGPYSGTINITATGASGPLAYPVILTVTAQPVLTVAPSPLTFSGTVSGANPASQTLTVSATNGPVSFTAAAATTSGGSWLSVLPTSGTTNTTLQVSVNTSGLSANTYSGSITVTATASGVLNSPFIIPVTLTVSSNLLTATPSPLNFTYSLGGTAPAAQTLNVGSTISGLSFTAAAGASWVGVTPGGGTTPQALSVSILPAGLTAGTYHSTVTLTSAGAGNSPLAVPVNLTVSAEPLLTVNPATVSLNYTTGGTAPTASVAVGTSNGAAAAFSVSTATVSGGSWLQASPLSGSSPASLLVSIVGAGLTTGTYMGTITVSAPGFISATVAVTLVVTQPKAVIQVTGNTFFTLANTAAPATSTLAISSSDGSAQPFTVSIGSSANNWLTVSPGGGTSPENVTLTANPSGLIPGIYIVPITVTMPALPIPSITIQAQLTITGSNLAASPSMLTFNYVPGMALPAQTVLLTTLSGSGTVALSSVKTDVGWLSVTPATSAPATLQVTVNPGLLPAGAATYNGNVIVKGVGSPATSLQIPVTVTINEAAQLTATPTSLTFTYQVGGAAPAAQSFALSGNGALNFTATSPGNWITLNPASGTTPASVLVTANPAGLAPGQYTGTINITASGVATPIGVAVTLIITAPAALVAAPAQLLFIAPAAGPAPAAQTVGVSSTGAPLGFTAASSAAWLGVTPTNGTTPAPLSISVNAASLAAGVYNGTITLTPAGSAAPQTIAVTLQAGNVTPTIAGVINAASGATGAVVPGMAISIFGSVLGPATGVSFAAPPAGGTVATTLGGTQVMFDGTAVPVLFASNGQVNALAPFELASKANTVLTVVYNGATSVGLTMPVVASEPGLFSEAGTGMGQGSILNQDYSINSSSHPAAAGSAIMLFGTGGGLTDPPSVDGTLNPISTTGMLTQTVTATIGGQTANVLYAGPAPGLVVGVMQINLTIPTGTPSGNVPVVVTVGTQSSQTGITVAVQ
jgi:uncharacterized protein (TIGR03437 family)